MILEGLVTTLDRAGRLNVAPMGPRFDAGMDRFVLRPFQTSTTYANLKATGAGVFHVVDDALLLARCAIGDEPLVDTVPARGVVGRVIASACHYFEFRVLSCEDREARASFEVETVTRATLREFFGWNRAKHGIVELAILATRVGIIADQEIDTGFAWWRGVVEKTGGADERAAYDLLVEFVARSRAARGRGDGLNP